MNGGDKMVEGYKEVYFHEYCQECKYWTTPMTEDPCNECLGEPANLYSHKPVKWEEAEK